MTDSKINNNGGSSRGDPETSSTLPSPAHASPPVQGAGGDGNSVVDAHKFSSIELPPNSPSREGASGVSSSDDHGGKDGGYDGNLSGSDCGLTPFSAAEIDSGPDAGTGATSQKVGCVEGSSQGRIPEAGPRAGVVKSEVRRAQLEISVEDAVVSGTAPSEASLHNNPSGGPAGTFFSTPDAYWDLIKITPYDAFTFQEIARQIVNDIRLAHKERALLLSRLDGKQEALGVPIPCPYCGYEYRHHSPSADCTGLEEKR